MEIVLAAASFLAAGSAHAQEQAQGGNTATHHEGSTSRHPAPARPVTPEAVPIWRNALASAGLRIVVSLEQRRLWLLDGDTELFSAPVAIGSGDRFTYADRSWTFETPRGRREVLGKAPDPLWVPPDWHYLEKAVARGLEPVFLEAGQRVTLSDSTFIEVSGDQVGRRNRFGNFWPVTPGGEIIFDGKIFVPPFGTAQRRIPDVLGTRKLVLGDGYLIHGTYDEASIGEAASHGCVRLTNPAVERLYEMVDTGTPVFIY